jgi:hypothetical protein
MTAELLENGASGDWIAVLAATRIPRAWNMGKSKTQKNILKGQKNFKNPFLVQMEMEFQAKEAI